MHKIKHKMLPNYLQDIINTQQVHYHNTRQREYNCPLPMPNTNAMKKSFIATEVQKLGIVFHLN